MELVAVLQLDVLGGIGETAYDLIASAHFDCIWGIVVVVVVVIVVVVIEYECYARCCPE